MVQIKKEATNILGSTKVGIIPIFEVFLNYTSLTFLAFLYKNGIQVF